MDQNSERILIYFDGVCNLCNFFVDFVIRRDPEGHFFFAPLQGLTAQKNLGDLGKNLNSVVVKDPAGNILTMSDAVLFVLSQLSWGWSLLSKFGRIFPKFFRDWIYKKVAAHRYFLFGQRKSCRLPSPEERRQFLD